MKKSRRTMLYEFHTVMGVPAHHRPLIPSDDRVRLRLEILREEFFELLSACLEPADANRYMSEFWHAERALKNVIQEAVVRVDLHDVADALTDMDYINEGTRWEFGIDGEPVFEEVHDSNMKKAIPHAECKGKGCEACTHGLIVRRREDGKVIKPEGWKPPDIARVLREQGWEG